MKIENQLPYAECYGCPKCVMKVKDEQAIYAADSIVERIITVGCTNEYVCETSMATNGRTMRYASEQ